MSEGRVYRVVQWATGSVGQLSIRAITERPVLDLVGCYVTRPEKVGRDAGDLAQGEPVGVRATGDIADVLSSGADCVHYAPLHPDDEEVCRLLEAGLNVVTPTFYVHPAALPPDRARRLEDACRRGGATLHGTGIHPGRNVGRGKDDTLFSLIDGVVTFERMRARNVVSVYTAE